MSVEHDKRIILYPAYINSKCTVAEGRRIPVGSACENPNVKEMMDCCVYLKIPSEIEIKHYPRSWPPSCRIRVQLRQEDGSPTNPDVPSRRVLMLKIAELVPKHPGRHKKAQKAEASSSSSGAAGNKQAAKKAGKKKKCP